MSIDSGQSAEGRQCIAFPQREKKSKERSTLRRSESNESQMKRTERRPERAEADGVFFALLGLIWFHFLKKAQSSIKEAVFRKQS